MISKLGLPFLVAHLLPDNVVEGGRTERLGLLGHLEKFGRGLGVGQEAQGDEEDIIMGTEWTAGGANVGSMLLFGYFRVRRSKMFVIDRVRTHDMIKAPVLDTSPSLTRFAGLFPWHYIFLLRTLDPARKRPQNDERTRHEHTDAAPRVARSRQGLGNTVCPPLRPTPLGSPTLY